MPRVDKWSSDGTDGTLEGVNAGTSGAELGQQVRSDPGKSLIRRVVYHYKWRIWVQHSTDKDKQTGGNEMKGVENKTFPRNMFHKYTYAHMDKD